MDRKTQCRAGAALGILQVGEVLAKKQKQSSTGKTTAATEDRAR